MIFKRRFQGASKFEFIAVVALLGVLAAVLLSRFLYYEERAEKAHMEFTASAIKSALRMRISLLLIQGRVQQYAGLAQQNPLDWLAQEAAQDNAFVTQARPDRTLAGTWSFDPASRTLVYLVRRGEYFEPDSAGQKRVRWQVRLIQDASNGTGKHAGNLVLGVALVLVEPYRWF